MRNFISAKPYRGINPFLLTVSAMQHGFDCPFWATFKQIKALGGYVRKGSKSSLVVFFTPWEKEVVENGEKKKKTLPVLRYYRVFNLEQADGIDMPDSEAKQIEFEPIAQAEKLLDDMLEKPEVSHTGNRACYDRMSDKITLPNPDHFTSSESYYCTSFHEHIHSTGHASRLGRFTETDDLVFGNESYSKEELVAEMGAAFLCAESGIEKTFDNSAAYIDGWLRVLKQPKNRKMVVTTASKAQAAADYMLGVNHD
jgi:antirestriction protein ArdC